MGQIPHSDRDTWIMRTDTEQAFCVMNMGFTCIHQSMVTRLSLSVDDD